MWLFGDAAGEGKVYTKWGAFIISNAQFKYLSTGFKVR